MGITVKEAAERLGVSQQFIRYAIRAGNFPGCYVPHKKRGSYYIPKDGLENFIRGIWRREDNAHIEYIRSKEEE